MSYDIDLVCDHCDGRFGEHLDPTYNLTPIFDLALTNEEMPNPEISEFETVIFNKETDRPRGLRLLSGVTATDSLRRLRQASSDMRNPEKEAMFKALEPENKWGDLKGAIWVIDKMVEQAEKYPKGIWKIR